MSGFTSIKLHISLSWAFYGSKKGIRLIKAILELSVPVQHVDTFTILSAGLAAHC